MECLSYLSPYTRCRFLFGLPPGVTSLCLLTVSSNFSKALCKSVAFSGSPPGLPESLRAEFVPPLLSSSLFSANSGGGGVYDLASGEPLGGENRRGVPAILESCFSICLTRNSEGFMSSFRLSSKRPMFVFVLAGARLECPRPDAVSSPGYIVFACFICFVKRLYLCECWWSFSECL